MVLVLTTLILPLLLVLLQAIFDASGSRPGIWCWLREWGAPVLLTSTGLMLLLGGVMSGDVHPGRQTLDHFLAITHPSQALTPTADELVCQPAEDGEAGTACYWTTGEDRPEAPP
jgi:hypothetical protein